MLARLRPIGQGVRLSKRSCPVNVAEVRKLDAYLKKLFGNNSIRLVPKTYDTGEVYVG